jgi:sporadic carbohydrate cluster protein (TIGR04323 family)
VTSRGFGGYVIPVPIQSLVLRDYCARQNLLYGLPVNENIFPGSYMVLEGLVRNLDGFEGVVMCSLHMLPTRPERRRPILQQLLDQGCSLHCVIEGLVIRTEQDLVAAEELLQLNDLAMRAPARLALD